MTRQQKGELNNFNYKLKNQLKMENLEMKRKGQVLTISIDLAKEGHPSTSGKTMTIASTQGSVVVPAEAGDKGQILIGVNVYIKPNKK